MDETKLLEDTKNYMKSSLLSLDGVEYEDDEFTLYKYKISTIIAYKKEKYSYDEDKNNPYLLVSYRYSSRMYKLNSAGNFRIGFLIKIIEGNWGPDAEKSRAGEDIKQIQIEFHEKTSDLSLDIVRSILKEIIPNKEIPIYNSTYYIRTNDLIGLSIESLNYGGKEIMMSLNIPKEALILLTQAVALGLSKYFAIKENKDEKNSVLA